MRTNVDLGRRRGTKVSASTATLIVRAAVAVTLVLGSVALVYWWRLSPPSPQAAVKQNDSVRHVQQQQPEVVPDKEDSPESTDSADLDDDPTGNSRESDDDKEFADVDDDRDDFKSEQRRRLTAKHLLPMTEALVQEVRERLAQHRGLLHGQPEDETKHGWERYGNEHAERLRRLVRQQRVVDGKERRASILERLSKKRNDKKQ